MRWLQTGLMPVRPQVCRGGECCSHGPSLSSSSSGKGCRRRRCLADFPAETVGTRFSLPPPLPPAPHAHCVSLRAEPPRWPPGRPSCWTPNGLVGQSLPPPPPPPRLPVLLLLVLRPFPPLPPPLIHPHPPLPLSPSLSASSSFSGRAPLCVGGKIEETRWAWKDNDRGIHVRAISDNLGA